MPINPSHIERVERTSILMRDTMLKERFLALWQRCLLPGAASDPQAIWEDLAQRYAEPHRYYHDNGHLAHCLEQLDLAAAKIRQPDQVEMAVWFHDVINRPGEKQNEQLSAEYFREQADGLIDAAFIDAVVALILVTMHIEAPSDHDQQFVCDIDLASFGCPWECFVRDSNAVKAEFPGTETEYYRGKTAFLNAMLARPNIFFTDFFNDRYERQARENIELLLRSMEQQGS